MIGLFFASVCLLLMAAVIGLAVGYRLRAISHGVLVRGVERDLNELTRQVGEAQVRRARRA